jgi:Holliday junction resolvase RusA-like endonuclease
VIANLFVEGDPVAQPRARATSFAGRARMYDPGTAKPWRERIAVALLASRSAEPLLCPVALWLTFYLRRPKSHLLSKGGLCKGAPLMPIGKPDIDNLVKAVQDELTQLSIWHDDSQLVQLTARKVYCLDGQKPGLLIDLRVAEPPA